MRKSLLATLLMVSCAEQPIEISKPVEIAEPVETPELSGQSVTSEVTLGPGATATIKTERWLGEFEELSVREEVRPKILIENAKRVLGL